MIRISIPAAIVREIPYTDKKGQPARLFAQAAYAFTRDDKGAEAPYPDKFEVILPKGQTMPYPEGDYTLHPSAVYVDRNGRLACTPRLTPLKAKATA